MRTSVKRTAKKKSRIRRHRIRRARMAAARRKRTSHRRGKATTSSRSYTELRRQCYEVTLWVGGDPHGPRPRFNTFSAAEKKAIEMWESHERHCRVTVFETVDQRIAKMLDPVKP